ncbi:MAG: flgK [Rhodospirillales bacterium]|jgi:flagellar hook-associated protein 1 FlgK|nr:flgK [Rhodospirillales bacterium]
MSIEALQSALQGLRISQTQMDIASRNIANAQTPGYTRKNVPLTTYVIGTSGFGVLAGNVQRDVDTALQADVWRQTGEAQRLTTLSSYIDRVLQVFGKPDAQNSVAADLSNLKDTFTKLSATPDSSVLQQEAVSRAGVFAKDVNQLANLVQQQRNQAQTDIVGAVTDVNAQLAKIATLNKQISAQVVNGGSAPDLQDQRDEAVRLVSEKMNISTFTRPDGVLVVQTREGRFLADTTATQVSYGPSAPASPTSTPFTPTPLGATSSYPTSAPALWIGFGSSAADLTLTNPSGQLGALLELRDTALPAIQAQLDEMSYGIAKQFNTAGLTLFTDPAGTNIAAALPPNLSSPSAAPPTGHLGLAQVLQVNALIDPLVTPNGPSRVQAGDAGLTNPGDATTINNVLNTAFGGTFTFATTSLGANGQLSTGLPGNTTILDFAQQLIAKQANDKSLIDQRLTFESSFRDSLTQRQQNQSGVSLDNETANVMTIQKAYSAAAHVISTVNKMLDDLLAAIR